MWSQRYFPCNLTLKSISRFRIRSLPPNSEVFGQLSIPLAAEVEDAGLKYFHLMLPGIRELVSPTPEAIKALQPYFTLYRVQEIDSIQPEIIAA